MICPTCRLVVPAAVAVCDACGAALRSGQAGFELILPDARRVTLDGVVTVGRAASATVRLDDVSVSRRHARILAANDPPVLEDTASRNGTYINDRPVTDGGAALADGAVLRLGDVELRVERRRSPHEPGKTMVLPAVNADAVDPSRPCVRAGLNLKRHGTVDGSARYTLHRDGGSDLLQFGEPETRLLALIDGTRTVDELLRDTQRAMGRWGVGRLVQLLAHLAELGLLAGGDTETPTRRRVLHRVLRRRELVVPGAGDAIARIYRSGGFALLTRAGLTVSALVAVAGLVAFVTLLVTRHGTPFVVASQLGLGALTFVAGRLAAVALHELAHGLVLASFGRKVPRAGVTFVLGIPFGFVDTSQAWLETRRRRLAVSIAGPSSDLVLGGALALTALVLGRGAGADVLVQLAMAAYVGAAVNLNPLLERDGHHILEDALDEPALRRRARAQIAARLAGVPGPAGSSRAVRRFGVASLAWLVLVALVVAAASVWLAPQLATLAPPVLVWTGVAVANALVVLPVVLYVVPPLRTRGRDRGRDAIW